MTKNELSRAVSLLKQGGLVAFPTETVYGLGADAANAGAIHRIYAAKERPYQNPLIVHLAEVKQLGDWVIETPDMALQLAEAFWPGPLTLILRKAPHVLGLVTGGQATIAVRIPSHPVAQALLKAFGSGIAAPSANKFTHLSPTTAAAVREELGGRIDLILEGGECEVGLESTIIDVSGEAPTLLRPGMITKAQLEQVLSQKVLSYSPELSIRAPGMHAVHYAPRTKTRVMTSSELPLFFELEPKEHMPVALLTHSGMTFSKAHVVAMSANPVQYAHDLYRVLRELDHHHFKQILIEAVPNAPEWDAIRDRLSKASQTTG